MDELVRIGLALCAVCVTGCIGLGATVLAAFIIGEVQRHGRNRWAKKKVDLEKGFEYLKAREDMIKRERRLAKEKLARDSMLAEDERPIYISM